MKLAVAVLVRNEIDIIGIFLRHLDALFDYAVLMDHGSIDGTAEALAAACARRPGWTMWHVDACGYHQSDFSAFALRHLVQHTDADIVTFLDADEFIDTLDRPALETALAVLTDPDSVGVLHWLNALPCQFSTRTIEPGEAIWAARTPGGLGKVALTRAFYDRHAREVRLGLGNHALAYADQRVVPSVPVGHLLHLPIRSLAQIKTKVLAGVFAVMMQAHPAPLQCWHWYDILYRLGDGSVNDADLIGMAVHYSQQNGQSAQRVAWADLPAKGFARRGLTVAFGEKPPEVAGDLAIDPVRLIATILRRFQVEDTLSSVLALRGDRLLFVPKPVAAEAGSAKSENAGT